MVNTFYDVVYIFNIFLTKAVEITMPFYQVREGIHMNFVLIHLIVFLKETSIFINSIG